MSAPDVAESSARRTAGPSGAPGTAVRPAPPRWHGTGLVVLLGSLAFLPAAATDMYLPSLPDVARDLRTTEAAAQLTISLVLVGAALAQLVIGPLSDRYGRRRPAVLGLAGFVLVSLACMVVGSIDGLVALRLLHGVVGAAASVVATAVIGDRWHGAEAARLLSRLWLAIAVAPVLAPLLGTVVAEQWGWRGVFGVLAAMGALLAVVVAARLPETRGSSGAHTVPGAAAAPTGVLVAAARGYAAVVRDRTFLAYAVVPGMALAVIMSYVTGSSFVLQDEYGLTPQQFALVFGVGATSMVVGSQANAVLVRRHGPARLLAVGVPGSVLTTGALLVVAAGQHGGVAGLLAPLWLTVGLLTGVMANAGALALSRHRDRAGTAAAVMGCIQAGLGGAVSPLVGVVGGGGAAMGGVMLASAATGLAALAVGTPVLRRSHRADARHGVV